MADDFEHLAVFFTKAFISDRHAIDPDRFASFERGRPFLVLSDDEAASIASLRHVRRTYVDARRYRDEILRARITALLYEIEAVHQDDRPTHRLPQTRDQRLADAFKRLVTLHVVAQRQVAFYPGALSVTPRHLSSTVHALTGRTASAWIREAVVLEARVLLLDPDHSAAGGAALLRFPDQSTFGKYFEQHVGSSPRECQSHRGRVPTS